MTDETKHNKSQVWLAYFLNPEKETFLNKAASARAAGYNCETQAGFAKMGKRVYQEQKDRIDQFFEDAGWSDEWIFWKIMKLADAKETKFYAHEGVVEDSRTVEALSTQIAALKMACQVKGLFAPEKREVTGKDGEPIQHQHGLSPEAQDLVNDIIGNDADMSFLD